MRKGSHILRFAINGNIVWEAKIDPVVSLTMPMVRNGLITTHFTGSLKEQHVLLVE
jgi:hypothetical protein